MLRQNTNETVKIVLKDSMGNLKTGLVATDFLGSNAYLYKADNTKVSIALTLGTNLKEIDSTDAPGLYSLAIPSSNLDQLGSLTLSFQPAASAFVAAYLTETVVVDGAAIETSIKGAQNIDLSSIAGGLTFIPGSDNLHLIRQALSSIPATISSSVWEELLASHITPNTLGELMNVLASILLNRIRLDKNLKQMIVYQADSATTLKTYNVYDENAMPSIINIAERSKAT